MGGFFGTVSKAACVTDLFYGTDYNSHMGTKRGGMATYAKGVGFMRSIHNLESSYFRTKFESGLSIHSGKEYENECMCVCVCESLCCIAEINSTL